MSASQIDEQVVIRIENELGILAEEMAGLCVPRRRSSTELRLRRSIVFGKLGDSVVWMNLHETPDPDGRSLELRIEDRTFDPGNDYGIRTVVSVEEPPEGHCIHRMILDMRRAVVPGIRMSVLDKTLKEAVACSQKAFTASLNALQADETQPCAP